MTKTLWVIAAAAFLLLPAGLSEMTNSEYLAVFCNTVAQVLWAVIPA